MGATRYCKKCGWMLVDGRCLACAGKRDQERERNRGKAS